MEDKKQNIQKQEEFEAFKQLLEKQIELEKTKQQKAPAWKIITLIFIGISAVAFLSFCCYMMYKQSFTMETLLAVLLSFFSIALSIMFYIQSEKSSSAYYMRSYEIMKEVSVTLGKIEASFGEKLSHINSSLEKFENNKKIIEDKLEQGEKEETEIKEKITKEKLNSEEKTRLLEDLQRITRENYELKNNLERIERIRKNEMIRHSAIREKLINQENILNEIMNNKRLKNYFMYNKHIDNSEDKI